MTKPHSNVSLPLTYTRKDQRRGSFATIPGMGVFDKIYPDSKKDFSANGVTDEVSFYSDAKSNKQIAIKRIPISQVSSTALVQEATLTADALGWSASHVDEKADYYYIATKKVTGTPYREYNFESTSHFLRINTLILRRLDELHKVRKIVHFDLNGGNLIVSPTGDNVTFIDLGLSNYIGKPLKPMPKDHLYAAPESVEKAAIADPSNDVYSVLRLFMRTRDKIASKLKWHNAVEQRFQTLFQLTQAEDPTARPPVTFLAQEMQHMSVMSYFLENQDRLQDNTFDAKQAWGQFLPAAVSNLDELTNILSDIELKNRLAFLKRLGIAHLRKIVLKEETGEVLSHLRDEDEEEFLAFFNEPKLLTTRRVKQLTSVSVLPSNLFKPAEDFIERGEQCLTLYLKTGTLDAKVHDLLKQPLGLEALGKEYFTPAEANLYGPTVLNILLTKEGVDAFDKKIITHDLIMKLFLNKDDVPKVLAKIIADRDHHLADKRELSKIYFPG